jgi:hypothetical protein
MSKRTHALVLAAIVAAMNLAALTAIAQAQPPDAVEQFRRGERASQQDNTPADAVERFRRGERASQEQTAAEDQTAADATVQRLLARERSSIPSGTPAQVPAPVQPDQPSGQPTWLVVSLGGLAAALAVVAGLALLAARRANRQAQVRPAA